MLPCVKRLPRTYDLLSRTYDLLSRRYDLLCRTYDLLCRTYDLLSRTYEIIFSHVAALRFRSFVRTTEKKIQEKVEKI